MKRHYCTFCKRKRSEQNMLKIEYRMLRKSAWICRSHASAFADIANIRTHTHKPRFVELFSGSGNISKIASMRGYETTTIDIEPRFNPDICIDIQNLRKSVLPGCVDVVWASIPCTVYSILNLESHWTKTCIGYRQYYYSPETPEALQALRILAKTIRLIKQLNPIFYFLENPRGALRHFPHMTFIPYRRTVSYADYGFNYYKPTDIFTNCKFFQPRQITGSVGKTFSSGVQTLNSAHERALVPPQLINELFESINFLTPSM